MCAPSPPKMPDIPIRQPVLIPDNGDPTVRGALKDPRRMSTSAMIFTGKGGTLGAPATTGPMGGSGL